MKRFVEIGLYLAAACVIAPTTLQAQQFSIFGREVQVHGFFSQGFGYTGGNNYLTMDTKNGSGAFTDAGVNMSMRITDKFRIGAQVYDRRIGELGKWHPQLDWAVADYRFKDWFGIRGGKVKTVFGLHNDTQDMEFLHTNALLPQSIYPTDLRDALIRHNGGDVYGEVPLKKLGSVSYTLFAGNRDDSRYGGYIYLLQNSGINMNSYGGLQYGGDIRWNTPVKGLLVGFSHMNEEITGKGTWSYTMGGQSVTTSYKEWSNKDQANQVYGQFTKGNLRLEAEYRRWWRDQAALNGLLQVVTDTRGWYALGAYRVHPRLELGTYYSRLVPQWGLDREADNNHVYDKVITARIDLKRFWNIKIEGHFMDGYCGSMYPAGFYAASNPKGFKPGTNLLLVRTGFNF